MVWLCADVAPATRRHWGAALMVAAWSCVEVPRYLLYTLKLALDRPELQRGINAGFLRRLYWLRDHLFIVLYPAGILGEVITLFSSHFIIFFFLIFCCACGILDMILNLLLLIDPINFSELL